MEPGPEDFRLTWYIDLVGTGWLEPAGVELNAVTGDVYFMEPGSIR